MLYVDHVIASVQKAEQSQSALVDGALNIPGFSGLKLKHLLNNIGTLTPLRYLEVGVHVGGTFVASLFQNTPELAIACDNWSQFNDNGTVRETFLANIERYLPGNKVIVLEKDCYTVTKDDIPLPINVYFYDGLHEVDDQYRALTHMYDMLDTEFIFMVDDWMWPEPKQGTYKAIKDLGLKILYETAVIPERGSDAHTWWNGIGICVLAK
jgi:hypothetical protein